jgi:hypothetical protein
VKPIANLTSDLTPVDLGSHTHLMVTAAGADLRCLVTGAAMGPLLVSPTEAVAVLQHVAVDVVLILDDVALPERVRVQAAAGTATVIAEVPAVAVLTQTPQFNAATGPRRRGATSVTADSRVTFTELAASSDGAEDSVRGPARTRSRTQRATQLVSSTTGRARSVAA